MPWPLEETSLDAICGSVAPLQGHEVWDYAETETTGTATLRGVNFVWQDCSSIHHFGRFQQLLAEGVITRQESSSCGRRPACRAPLSDHQDRPQAPLAELRYGPAALGPARRPWA